MVAQADADGAAGSGQDGRHGVQVDQHVCYSLQGELFVHYCLPTHTDSTLIYSLR